MNVRARIREKVRDTPDPSPAAVAASVLHDLPDADLRPALAVALPYLARDEIRKLRHVALGRRGSAERGQEAWDAVVDDIARQVPERSRKLRVAGRKGFDGAQARRERDSALLSTPVALAADQWKALGDCTAEDLRAIARFQRRRAEENERRADGFDRLADRLDKLGVETVRECTSQSVRDDFGAIVA